MSEKKGILHWLVIACVVFTIVSIGLTVYDNIYGKSELRAIEERISSISGQINESNKKLETTIVGLGENISAISGTIEKLGGKVSELDRNLSVTKAIVGDLGQSIKSIGSRLQDANGTISELEQSGKELDELNARFNELVKKNAGAK